MLPYRHGPGWLALLLVAGGYLSFGQLLQDRPTVPEITGAYRAKAGEHAGIVPGLRWERWRIKEIRGWSLKFHRLSERRDAGVFTRRYRVVAQKNKTCAEYAITEVLPYQPNVQIGPVLNVESGDLSLCR